MHSPEFWQEARAQFPALANWTYLNTATFGQLPRCATDAVARHWAARDEAACWNFLDWFDDADRLRTSLGNLVGASAADIAFSPSASNALSLVVNGLNLKPEHNIVTLTGDFPNQLYLPQLREVSWKSFFDAVDSSTRMVAFSEVNYANGFRPPLADICGFLEGRDTVLFLDGTQSSGALRFDVRETPVDVYAAHAYKWMISPNGAGFFFISPRLRERLKPAVVGWRSHRDWRNVDNLHHGPPVFSDRAEKYEGGGLPSSLLYAMEASLGLIQSLGIDSIEQRVLELAALTRQSLRAVGASAPETGSQIVSAQFPGRDVSILAKQLRAKRVLVSARHGNLRVSPHFYNNEEDIQRLQDELRRLL